MSIPLLKGKKSITITKKNNFYYRNYYITKKLTQSTKLINSFYKKFAFRYEKKWQLHQQFIASDKKLYQTKKLQCNLQLNSTFEPAQSEFHPKRHS